MFLGDQRASRRTGTSRLLHKPLQTSGPPPNQRRRFPNNTPAGCTRQHIFYSVCTEITADSFQEEYCFLYVRSSYLALSVHNGKNMSNTISLSGAGSHERVEGRFLINHVTVAQAVYAPDAEEHRKIISHGNIWTINVVNAQYVAGTSVRTGQVAIPTTMDTGWYIALEDGYDPARDLYPINEKNMTSGQIVVVLDPDNVHPSNKLTRMLIEGVAYVNEDAYNDMLSAIDKE